MSEEGIVALVFMSGISLSALIAVSAHAYKIISEIRMRNNSNSREDHNIEHKKDISTDLNDRLTALSKAQFARPIIRHSRENNRK